MSVGNPDMIDRRSRGLQRPWDSMAHHVHILNKPEQLRGPQSPHRKAGPQTREARVYLRLLTERMSLDMRRYLSILDIQDSCCPLFFLLSLDLGSYTLLASYGPNKRYCGVSRLRRNIVGHALAAKVVKKTKDSLQIKITKQNFESFCDSIGLYRKEFLDALSASEHDHRAGRVTKRKSLRELIA